MNGRVLMTRPNEHRLGKQDTQSSNGQVMTKVKSLICMIIIKYISTCMQSSVLIYRNRHNLEPRLSVQETR